FDAFQSMANQVKKGIIAHGDDKYLQKLQTKVPIIFYGLSPKNDFYATNIQLLEAGTQFDVYVRDTYFDTFMIPLFGDHHILNALSIIAFCHYEEIDVETMKNLATFGGVKRRFSEKIVQHQVIIDDYAHHPIEIAATIDSARKKYKDKKVIAIFQPHTFTRTKTFLDEFATSLNEADHIYLCDIFSSARESTGNLTIEDLLIKVNDGKLLTVDNVAELQQYEDSVLVFMGAGDIQKFQKAYEDTLLGNSST